MFEKKISVSQLFPSAIRSIDFGIPVNLPQRLLSNYSEFKSKASHEEEENPNPSLDVEEIGNEDAEELQNLLNLRSSGVSKMLGENKSEQQAKEKEVVGFRQNQKYNQGNERENPGFPRGKGDVVMPEHVEGAFEDTKNLLRNFGNAQNQYILYNQRARAIVSQNMTETEKFYVWVRRLKLQNFEQYKKVWGGDSGNKLFTRLYKQLCWKFYVEEAASYVLMSRMKNQVTKMTHLKHIHRFLEGIRDPQNFRYFKKQ